MAALVKQQYAQQWSDGQADRVALYALRNVTTGDTADLSEQFTVIKRAIILGTTVAGTAVATVSGITVTMPSGLANDAGYLLVFGCAA
jgi:uncharacterized membrane protein